MKSTKTVPVRDLVYISIIFVITVLSIIAINNWNNGDATSSLNNAATAVSIVLAVVAIVITLVDVAGQRQNVLDLKETVDKLGEYYTNAEELNDNLASQLSQIADLKDKLLETIDQSSEWRSEMFSKLGSLVEESKEKQQSTISVDDIKKTMIDLSEYKLSPNYDFFGESIMDSYNTSKKTEDAIKLLKQTYHKGKRVNGKELRSIITKGLGISLAHSNRVVRDLLRIGIIKKPHLDADLYDINDELFKNEN